MNKEELIERIEDFPCEASLVAEMIRINKNTLLGLVKELDEPQKVKIPKFVADWIEKCKSEKRRLHEALTYTPFRVNGWVSNPDNQETFARAWLDGYTVEEKRYTVKIKAVDQYLVSAKDENFLGFLTSKLRTYFTRKELEEVGFDWVFDCEGIELEEVEE